ncbi:hypothetical protein TNCV_3205741 [Trichonephila clavipes]|nr:hypothetical protein TNCV_3205741 [Trichonephila clavipes]
MDMLTNELTDKFKDMSLPSSAHTSRPGTPHDSTCKRRLALTEKLNQLTFAIQTTNTAINNIKAQGITHSFLIDHQLQLQATYEKDLQHVIQDPMAERERVLPLHLQNQPLHHPSYLTNTTARRHATLASR